MTELQEVPDPPAPPTKGDPVKHRPAPVSLALSTPPDAAAPAPIERADAARNRRKIIEAADRIVADRGTSALSLDEVAREAQLGVGTVYRRFGDRAGLVYALLHEMDLNFQTAFTAGPPPLGPGAPPADRIRAFLHALVDHTAKHTGLLLEAESNSPSARLRSKPYALHHVHLAMLIAQARPDADPHFLAEALLAPLSATYIEHLREHGASYLSIKTGIDQLLHWPAPAPPPPG
jgi:AcrR family transcriptional regulator